MKFVIAVTTFLVLWIVNQVVPANGQLSRTSPPPGSVVCPGARVEYTCQSGEAGGISVLTWSIDGVDLSAFSGDPMVLTPGDTRNFSGGVATLTDVSPSGLNSTFVIVSAGEGVTNRTVIGCNGIEVNDAMTLDIVSTEVASVTLSPGGLTVSTVQVGVATPEAVMCTDTVYCVDIPEANIMNHCMQSRTISLPQELNLCQRNYNVTAYRNGSTTTVSTMTDGNSNGLGSVTNIMSNSTHLFWSPPPNGPENCVTGYEISWNGGSFNHSVSDENMPSVSFDELKRNTFPLCETVDVTISPFIPALGVLRDNAGSIAVRLGLDGIEDTGLICFNNNGSLEIAVQWTPFNKVPQDGDSCSCTIGGEPVECDPTFSSCVLTVENNTISTQNVSYSILVNYEQCGPTNASGIITAPENMIGMLVFNISGTSATLTLNLTGKIINDEPVPVITLDGRSNNSKYMYSNGQLIVKFPGLETNTEYEYSIEIQSHQIGFCGDFMTGSSSSEFRWWIIVVVVVVVGGGAGGGGTATVVIIRVYKKKQKKKSKDEEEVELEKPREKKKKPREKKNEPREKKNEEAVELKKSGELSSQPVASKPASEPPTYADSNAIRHETGPETGELYAVAAKPSKKKKNEQPQELATYQDPNSIKHEAAGEAGDMYAIPDKKPKKSSKKTKTAPEPQPTEAELQQMYSVPDKTKKTRNQGVVPPGQVPYYGNF